MLKRIVSEIIQHTYNEFVRFFTKNKISDELRGGEKLEKMDMIIQQNATPAESSVLNFIHSILLDIERDDLYLDITDYIQSIATDANEIISYKKGWGGSSEIKILSALLCQDINVYPSNSSEIEDLEEYYSFKYKDTSKMCIIPPEYKLKCSNIHTINIGYLEQPPQHYFSIIDTDDLEAKLYSILEKDVGDQPFESNLQKILNMGYDFDVADNALRLNQNNIDMALNYIFRSVQTNVDLLESDDIYNLEFQTNSLEVNIGGRYTYISQFHEGGVNSYYQNYSFLERTHDYIQWLFPMSHQSVNNPDSRSILKTGELRLLKQSGSAKDNLFKSLRTMMDFFGGNLTMKYDYDYPEPMFYDLQSNDNIYDRLLNINDHPHNCLRITRILNYLDSMEEYRLQYLIINFFIDQVFFYNHETRWSTNIIDSLSKYWIKEVSDPREQLSFQQAITVYDMLLERRIQTKGDGAQVGGGNSLKPLVDDYYMFPFRYHNKIYNIVYVVHIGGQEKPSPAQTGGRDKKVQILGIMHGSGQIMLEKNIKNNTDLDKVLIKVSKKIFNNKLNIPKKKFIKLDYIHDAVNNNIMLNGKVVGKMTRGKKIVFN